MSVAKAVIASDLRSRGAFPNVQYFEKLTTNGRRSARRSPKYSAGCATTLRRTRCPVRRAPLSVLGTGWRSVRRGRHRRFKRSSPRVGMHSHYVNHVQTDPSCSALRCRGGAHEPLGKGIVCDRCPWFSLPRSPGASCHGIAALEALESRALWNRPCDNGRILLLSKGRTCRRGKRTTQHVSEEAPTVLYCRCPRPADRLAHRTYRLGTPSKTIESYLNNCGHTGGGCRDKPRIYPWGI